MKTYQVVNDCVRQPFNKRMFRKGEVIELKDDIDPGANFKLIDKAPKKEVEKDEPTALSELQKKQGEASKPKSGFASKPKKT